MLRSYSPGDHHRRRPGARPGAAAPAEPRGPPGSALATPPAGSRRCSSAGRRRMPVGRAAHPAGPPAGRGAGRGPRDRGATGWWAISGSRAGHARADLGARALAPAQGLPPGAIPATAACRSRPCGTGCARPGPLVGAGPGRPRLRRAGIRVADGVAVLSGFVPRVEGGDAEIDRVIRILEDAESEPAQRWPSWSSRPGGGTSAPSCGWRRAADGSRRSSGSGTTPARPSTGSPPRWPRSAARAPSPRPRSATGWASAASTDPVAGVGRRQGDHRAGRGRRAGSGTLDTPGFRAADLQSQSSR